MEVEEAKILLGFSPNSRPDPCQVKAAYRKKVWESHPDLFPDDHKLIAESKFKSVILKVNDIPEQVKRKTNSTLSKRSEFGYTFDESLDFVTLKKGVYSRVVKTGVPRTYAYAKRGNAWLIGAPFLLIVLGTIGLGGMKANRAYNMQKQTFPSHNPFLP